MLGLDDRIAIEAADTLNPDEALLRQNPLGKVPTLVLPDGEVLYDSAVIVDYLDWRWVLWVNVPIGLVVALLAPRVLGESERRRGA